MLRLIFISLLILIAGLLLLQGRLKNENSVKPVFLKVDEVANAHQTKINTTLHSIYKPDSFQLEKLKQDYSNIWAHLNHLYYTNDVEAGKEYYTEDWFKQICLHFNGVEKSYFERKDDEHHLHIQNWASDGLVCTAIDSNVVFRYQTKNNLIKKTKANIAVVLLIQGDHWRIDALRIIDEKNI